MLDFTWKIFRMTGNVNTYLLLKEIEERGNESEEPRGDEDPINLNLTGNWNQTFV